MAEAFLFRGKTGHDATPAMKNYSCNTTLCRRKLLFQGFLSYNESELDKVTKCRCCDICAMVCKCSKCC